MEREVAAQVELLAARHWRIIPPFMPSAESHQEQIAMLTRLIGVQIYTVLPFIGADDYDLVICSTYLSPFVMGVQVAESAFYDGIERETGKRPLAVLHSYECAGWGYALRFFACHTYARKLAVAIVDIDLHDLEFYAYHPLIGHSGFGLSILVFDLPGYWQPTASTGGPYPASAVKELLHAIRSHHMAMGRSPTFLPYFREDFAKIGERVIGSDIVGPNRHADYGHCFGSDPWIGIIEYLQKTPIMEPRTVIAAAVAYSGYYTFCPITLTPRTAVELRILEGDDEALARFVRA